jgi:branched-chain amino acid transport system permease protein
MIHNRQIGLTATPQGFDLFTSIEVLLMVVLGGMGSLTGSLLAAAVLVYLPELPRFLPALGGVDLAEKRQLIYAVLLIVLIRLVPDGLLGMRELPRWLTGLAGRTRRGRVP